MEGLASVRKECVLKGMLDYGILKNLSYNKLYILLNIIIKNFFYKDYLANINCNKAKLNNMIVR